MSHLCYGIWLIVSYVLKYALRRGLRFAKYAAIGGVIAFLGAGVLGTVGSGLAWFAAPGVFGGMGLGIAWATIKVSWRHCPNFPPESSDTSSPGDTGQSDSEEVGGPKWSTALRQEGIQQRMKRRILKLLHKGRKIGESGRMCGCALNLSVHRGKSVIIDGIMLRQETTCTSPNSHHHHHEVR